MAQLFLSRRNLLTLLAKLDKKKKGEKTLCQIVKSDNKHPVYSQTLPAIIVTALEDEEYYTDRQPGRMIEDEQ